MQVRQCMADGHGDCKGHSQRAGWRAARRAPIGGGGCATDGVGEGAPWAAGTSNTETGWVVPLTMHKIGMHLEGAMPPPPHTHTHLGHVVEPATRATLCQSRQPTARATCLATG